MTFRVLVSAPYMQGQIERFRARLAAEGVEIVVPRVNERLEECDLLPLVGDIDGVICGDDRFTAAVLDAAPRLRVISKWGTGIDSIDQAACAARNIAVRNTPNAFSEPVADSVLGYMLCFARRLPWMAEAVRSGSWSKIPGVSLRECTLGVIGVGNVGSAVARRARAFGMRVIGADIRELDGRALAALDMKQVDLPVLLAESDFISVNCDLNPSSRHLLNDAAFAAMVRRPVVINTARGPVIDEPALVRALETERIGGAALDVFEEEPLPADSPLRRFSNVMMAAHNANSSPAAWEHVHERSIRNLLDVLTAHA